MSLDNISAEDANKLMPQLIKAIDEEIKQIKEIHGVINEENIDSLESEFQRDMELIDEAKKTCNIDRMAYVFHETAIRAQRRSGKIPDFCNQLFSTYQNITPNDHGIYTCKELNWCVEQGFINRAEIPRSKEEMLEYMQEKKLNEARVVERKRKAVFYGEGLKFEIIKEGANLVKARQYDAGYDIVMHSEFKLEPHEKRIFHSGLKIFIPRFHFGRIEQRSSCANLYNVQVLGGIIDHEYKGEIKIVILNLSTEPIVFKAGDRAFQVVIAPCYFKKPKAVEVRNIDATIDETTNRGFRFVIISLLVYYLCVIYINVMLYSIFTEVL